MLTRKDTKWQWGKEQENAFEGLKSALSKATVLQPLQWGKPWFIDCDASNTAVGAVLSQEEPDTKEEHPVYYYSRLLNLAERNYSTTDRECLAVIAAIKKFRVYVLGAPLEIRTDHAAIAEQSRRDRPIRTLGYVSCQNSILHFGISQVRNTGMLMDLAEQRYKET